MLRSEQPPLMALHHRALLLLWSFALWLALAAGQPEHSISYFDNLPSRLFFFDDAPVRAPRGAHPMTRLLTPASAERHLPRRSARRRLCLSGRRQDMGTRGECA